LVTAPWAVGQTTAKRAGPDTGYGINYGKVNKRLIDCVQKKIFRLCESLVNCKGGSLFIH
jgi:hypothetical protein